MPSSVGPAGAPPPPLPISTLARSPTVARHRRLAACVCVARSSLFRHSFDASAARPPPPIRVGQLIPCVPVAVLSLGAPPRRLFQPRPSNRHHRPKGGGSESHPYDGPRQPHCRPFHNRTRRNHPPPAVSWEIRGWNRVLNSSLGRPPASLCPSDPFVSQFVAGHEDITVARPAGHGPPLAVASGLGMARLASAPGFVGGPAGGRGEQTYVHHSSPPLGGTTATGQVG